MICHKIINEHQNQTKTEQKHTYRNQTKLCCLGPAKLRNVFKNLGLLTRLECGANSAFI